MTDQLLPFDLPTWRNTDPATSQHAGALDRLPLRVRVRHALQQHPDGLTDHELTAVLHLESRRKPTVAKRRQELGAVPVTRTVGTHPVVWTENVTRPSPDNCPCIVWRLP